MNTALKLTDRGLVPLPLLRFGIRRLCAQRLRDESASQTSGTDAWIREMDRGPVAEVPEKANEQHYEVPPALFEASLGPNLKYSSCFFPDGTEDLETGEQRMLEITCERAQLEDGQTILELGCGWGSLTLWMAKRYPNSRVVGVSNSAPQRQFILSRAKERGLENVQIITKDMNEFEALAESGIESGFDRVVSVEMFEHMRDWRTLFERVRGWIKPTGKMFIHIFTHRTLNYPFDVKDDTDWMSKYFFSGGMMPSDDLMEKLTSESNVPFAVEDHTVVSGRHYSRTAKLWRENLEARRVEVMPVLTRTYGDQASAWFQRWRIFFLACEELFGYRDGSEWAVSHYLLVPTPVGSRAAREGAADSEAPMELPSRPPGASPAPSAGSPPGKSHTAGHEVNS